ncbi:hypothetical protein HMPREF3140_17770 [Klebsiella sp. HMSC16A12]|nr:hypothetical protein HMPREF3140_17770 [Klebsiella sp. HMSC16A12]
MVVVKGDLELAKVAATFEVKEKCSKIMIVMMIAAFSSETIGYNQFYKYGKANRKIPATISVSLGSQAGYAECC